MIFSEAACFCSLSGMWVPRQCLLELWPGIIGCIGRKVRAELLGCTRVGGRQEEGYSRLLQSWGYECKVGLRGME